MLLRPLAAVLALLAVAACDGSPSGPPESAAPVITVTGVTAGGSYTGSVSIGISVDRGSYSATLNGASFTGGTVTSPGSYTLQVAARNGTATSTASVPFTLTFAGSRVLIVRLLDLGDNESGGGGDAILLTDSTGSGLRHGLIDAGPQGVDASNPGYVLQRLRDLGVTRLDFVELTHAHADHYAGLAPVLNAIPTGWFVYNGQQRANIGGYQTVLSAAGARADSVVVPAAVTALPFGFGGGTLSVIPPLPTYLGNANASGDELNEGSLGTSLTRGSFRMFFTGDGEMEANARWRTGFAALTGNVTALKVGHHGANNAVFDDGFRGASAWLAHTAPRLAVISANGRSHPRQNALNAILGLPQTETYCTSVHGEIAIRIAENGQYAVTVQRNATLDCRPGSEATT
ncbi:ComEC/Rec2 family competence protein [Longimicrobium sp.]|uniref:ComEC/Rec2 family competence protein n=1 Tax=Longimicrobium sp. TaxID=2029185 RepID=UPI002E2F5261|nr:MBL fold metallo-hydrolase [Longimicrobium sp.]HEX6036858.1 MBL fold metallo-hydrolase [Longimicrobium sp.]